MASPTAGCDPGDIGKAINDVYDPSPARLAAALVGAGFDTLELATRCTRRSPIQPSSRRP
jgi:hypothetical protein